MKIGFSVAFNVGAIWLLGGCNSGEATKSDAGSGAGCPTDMSDLIADFKTDNGLNPADGRMGGFYVYGDPSPNAAFDPPKMGDAPYPIDSTMGNPNCAGGAGSFRVKGTGFRMWGAAAATDFKPKVGTFKAPYNAGGYRGVSFWIKASAPVSGVQVQFPDIYTSSEANPADLPTDPNACILAGGPSACAPCVLLPGAISNCSPYLVKLGIAEFPDYTTSTVDKTWKRVEVQFAHTRQDQFNAGQKPANDKVDSAHLLGMAIQVNANFTTMPPSENNFEIWIDDVAFFR